MSQAFHSLLSGALHPLTDGPFSYPQSFAAISFCFQPCSFSSKARKRLPSRQLLAWLDNIFSIVELITPTTLDFYAEISKVLHADSKCFGEPACGPGRCYPAQLFEVRY